MFAVLVLIFIFKYVNFNYSNSRPIYHYFTFFILVEKINGYSKHSVSRYLSSIRPTSTGKKDIIKWGKRTGL